MGLGEPFSSISHMVGGGLAVLGAIVILLVADTSLEYITGAIYGVGLIGLYTLSSVYHGFPGKSQAKPWLRRMDHVGIYLLIAGTYTPVSLVGIQGGWGLGMTIGVWSVGIIGIVTKLTLPITPKWVTAGTYTAMGWMAVIGFPAILRAFSSTEIFWLLAGGVTYTLGAVIYALNRKKRILGMTGHDVWHLFVMGGSICHYILIAFYIL